MRILIDTSFLLPILGIEVKYELNRIIEKFPNHEIYYSEFSLLEVLWILKRINKKGVKVEMKRLREGLRSLRAYNLLKTPVIAYIKSFEMRDTHPDLIDLLLYYTAKSYNVKFLTLDEKIKELDRDKIVINTLD